MGSKIWIVISGFLFFLGLVSVIEFTYYLAIGASVDIEYTKNFSFLNAISYLFVFLFSFFIAYLSLKRYTEEPSQYDGSKKPTHWILGSILAFGMCIVSFYILIIYSNLPWEERNIVLTVLGHPLLTICLGITGLFFLIFAYIDSRKEQKGKQIEKKGDLSPAFDELKQLKQLLDMGAITQEEYDQKKKKILEKI